MMHSYAFTKDHSTRDPVVLLTRYVKVAATFNNLGVKMMKDGQYYEGTDSCKVALQATKLVLNDDDNNKGDIAQSLSCDNLEKKLQVSMNKGMDLSTRSETVATFTAITDSYEVSFRDSSESRTSIEKVLRMTDEPSIITVEIDTEDFTYKNEDQIMILCAIMMHNLGVSILLSCLSMEQKEVKSGDERLIRSHKLFLHSFNMLEILFDACYEEDDANDNNVKVQLLAVEVLTLRCLIFTSLQFGDTSMANEYRKLHDDAKSLLLKNVSSVTSFEEGIATHAAPVAE